MLNDVQHSECGCAFRLHSRRTWTTKTKRFDSALLSFFAVNCTARLGNFQLCHNKNKKYCSCIALVSVIYAKERGRIFHLAEHYLTSIKPAALGDGLYILQLRERLKGGFYGIMGIR